jgi:hypothetical protein
MSRGAIVITRRGRPPKKGVSRFPGGKVREEHEHVVKSVVWAQRAREVGEEHKDNALAGFTLGRLRLIGRANENAKGSTPIDPAGISAEQYDAGWQYGVIVRRHSMVMGYALGTPKSPGFEMVAGGTSLASEPDQEIILRTRRKFSDCYRALMDAGNHLQQGTRVATITYDVCLERVPFSELDEARLGNLKIGLNALARVLR